MRLEISILEKKNGQKKSITDTGFDLVAEGEGEVEAAAGSDKEFIDKMALAANRASITYGIGDSSVTFRIGKDEKTVGLDDDRKKRLSELLDHNVLSGEKTDIRVGGRSYLTLRIRFSDLITKAKCKNPRS